MLCPLFLSREAKRSAVSSTSVGGFFFSKSALGFGTLLFYKDTFAQCKQTSVLNLSGYLQKAAVKYIVNPGW